MAILPILSILRGESEYDAGFGALHLGAVGNIHIAHQLGLIPMSRTVAFWILVSVVLVSGYGGSLFVDLIVDYNWF